MHSTAIYRTSNPSCGVRSCTVKKRFRCRSAHRTGRSRRGHVPALTAMRPQPSAWRRSMASVADAQGAASEKGGVIDERADLMARSVVPPVGASAVGTPDLGAVVRQNEGALAVVGSGRVELLLIMKLRAIAAPTPKAARADRREIRRVIMKRTPFEADASRRLASSVSRADAIGGAVTSVGMNAGAIWIDSPSRAERSKTARTRLPLGKAVCRCGAGFREGSC